MGVGPIRRSRARPPKSGFDVVLFRTAAAEGSRQSRSARQQLEHWARLGAALSAQVESPLNRVRLAL